MGGLQAPPMQSLRAYGGAGVVEDTLYCIGGLGGGNLVDQVGWGGGKGGGK